MHADVLLINFTTTPHFHALFARFFHLPCWYSFQFLSFGNTFAFWMRGLVVKLISKTSSCIRPIDHFLNHAQSKLRVLLVAKIPDYNILWYLWSLIIYLLSVISDLFTFFIQSVTCTNRVSPPTETITLLCAWLRKWLIRNAKKKKPTKMHVASS